MTVGNALNLSVDEVLTTISAVTAKSRPPNSSVSRSTQLTW